jgi:hypothetical protein
VSPAPIEALARPDKWYLGCGDGIIFAPPFPLWLDAPGFWDEATIYQYAFGPLFTVTILDQDGRELPLRARARRWTPADLTVDYEMPNGLEATEVRSVQPGGVFGSEWVIRAPQRTTLHAVAWTVQDTNACDLDSLRWQGALSFSRTLRDRREQPFAVRAELACFGEVASWLGVLSERVPLHPVWRYAPFAETWRGEKLPRTIRLEGLNRDGVVYAAVHHALPPNSIEVAATFAMRLVPASAPTAPLTWRATPPIGQSVIARQTVVSAAPASSVTSVRTVSRPTPAFGPATGAGALARQSHRRWEEQFARAPKFACSDPYLERYYWYRWYGLWLNAIAPGFGNYEWPTVCEGIGFFHNPISYSAPCHVRELRWLSDRALARGVLRTFFGHQKKDGKLHGRIYANHLEGTDFYHGDWGGAVLALDAIAPDDDFAREIYPALTRYADWLRRERDRDESGMIDVVDQYETGQEYMPRYQAVDPLADARGWDNRIRLKGIDATVYAYSLFRALARLAPRAGVPDEAGQWDGHAERTRRAVREAMWNPETAMFSDVNPETGRRTGVMAAVCFYPYFTDIVDEDHLVGFEQSLFDPARFWTPYPVPTTAVGDPLFSATAEWKGKRHACPWNGRVWPMTNSHVIEALGRWATPEHPNLRAATAHLIRRFVRMMFRDGDLERPNSFEHYNPLNGTPSAYRGIDDYQHSWVADLLLEYVAGIRPDDGRILVDPLPFGLEWVEVRGASVRGRQIDVRIDGSVFSVTVDGDFRLSRIGEPIVVDG